MFSFQGLTQKLNKVLLITALLFVSSSSVLAHDGHGEAWNPDEGSFEDHCWLHEGTCNTNGLGDNECAAECNIAECGYDGGDCCNSTNSADDCIDDSSGYGAGCDCLDPDACNNVDGYTCDAEFPAGLSLINLL